MSQDQKDKAIASIANVSSLLRSAIAATIPVAPEQYLTIAIPGTVIDTRSVEEGGTLIYDATKPFVPTAVRQEESRLVDKMVPLANVMVGNTGKSVARSYSRALDCLLPRIAEVKDSDGKIRSPGSKLYNNSMAKLKVKDPATGLTPVDVYIEKQAAWAAAQSEWDDAKVAAQDAAMNNPDNLNKDGTLDRVKVQQEYNDWNQGHYRKYKFAVQGRWMDWVTNGNKYEVENDFGIVDVDSIMARIEDSKESMRNSTFVDSDGSNELQIVHLTPADWATQCMHRAQGWYQKNGSYSVDQLNAEISRLQRLSTSFEALSDSTVNATSGAVKYPIAISGTSTISGEHRDDAAVKAALADVYAKQGELNKNVSDQRFSNSAADATKEANLKAAMATLRQRVAANKEYHAQLAKNSVATLDGTNKQHLQDWIRGRQSEITTSLDKLKAQRDSKGQSDVALPVIQVTSDGGDGEADDGNTGVEIAGADATQPAAIFSDDSTGNNPSTTDADAQPKKADPWTTITASFKAADQSQTTDQSSWGASFSAGATFGLWSAGGNYAHEEGKKDSVSDMASCDVSITFSAMVVNIDRPWLYGELFNDFDLDVANDVLISPGAQALKTMMQQQANSNSTTAQNATAYLAQYSNFPAYPTSFLIAADTTIEFTGNTSHIENHFSSKSNSGGLSVGYGPFHVESSFHKASSHSNFQMQSTATGVKLCFGAPQVIGWVSQILPELPRKSGYEPMVQNTRPTITSIVPPVLG